MAAGQNIVFGLDIGGSGVKGAPVDVSSGMLAGDRFRVPTPQPATPAAVAGVVAEVTAHFDWSGPVGATFPAVVKQGTALTAANVDGSWIGTDINAVLGETTGCRVTAVNDADAAGIAEMAFGAGRDRSGVVVMTTLGTGIGTAVFLDGRLLPNTELGHLEIDGYDGETRASDSAREREGLSWDDWAERLTRYLRHLEDLLWPDLIILGGGVSKKANKYLSSLRVRTEVVPATLLNNAGIVGAALAAVTDPVAQGFAGSQRLGSSQG
ncbi:MAG: polyphosphate glucokinase [Frankiaceae bacterium]|jgi:polyphosphate glucokinase|nr:polyphosphate glucokinase [Frankiaceae bacterium]MDQ1648489.1 polyphosphate glucokinase [Frankiaceae bacterium]MDQ1674348.1 polyphosphate glucokinase [Frankiaceae bacterium]